MPRIRSIKPQFWLDERLGEIDRNARLLYIGLWNLSDDQGVFEWRPARIKIQIFPYDSDVNSGTIQQWLELLISSGDIIQFNCNGGVYGYIPTFLKHQEIKKPSKWHYATIPDNIVPHQLPTTSPLDTHQCATSGEAVPLGSREGGVGSRESNTIINNSDVLEKHSPSNELKNTINKIIEKSPYGEGIRQVFAGLVKKRGYKTPKNQAEAKSIRNMLKEGYTPNQILDTWEKLKADDFWQGKELYMMSVEKQIGAILKANQVVKTGKYSHMVQS